jgi:hypothetical protein
MRRYKPSKTVKLYHLSSFKWDDNTVFYPRVPDNTIDGEDLKTKRVCVSTSVTGCFKSLSYYGSGSSATAWLYKPIQHGRKKISEYIFKPTEDEVPDVKYTKEKWITCPVKMKCLGYATIRPQDNKKDKVEIFYDNNE